MADLLDTIATEATLPQSSTADGQSATARSLIEMLQVAQSVDANAAMKKRRRGVLFTKLTPPGALSDCGRSGVGPFESPGLY